MQIPKDPAWIPYLQTATLIGNDKVNIKYNDGETIIHPSSTLSLLIYGDCNDLPIEVIEEFGRYGVPIIFHKRNISKNIWISNGPRADKNDTLTKQILLRNDLRRKTYISRVLIYNKFKYFDELFNISIPKLSGMTVSQIRITEAKVSRVYWRSYYNGLEQPSWTRRSNNPVSFALDACSKFIAGIILRWISYHHMSPYHGFLHIPTDYPSLVYDLMEPYRYISDLAVAKAYIESKTQDKEKLTAMSISNLKDELNKEIYCIQTRQLLRRQQLLHGICLSLRAYLLGEGKRFIVPTEGETRKGRRIKTNFVIPGKSAGYTKLVLGS